MGMLASKEQFTHSLLLATKATVTRANKKDNLFWNITT